MKPKEIKDFIRSKGVTFPGRYTVYLCMKDGGVLSWQAARDNYRLIRRSDSIEWTPVYLDINFENNELYCSHTGVKIEPSYD